MIGDMLSLEQATLEPDGTLTVLVGPNGTGKSTVVRAVTLAGLGLEWLEERSLRLPGPETAQPARNGPRGAVGHVPGWGQAPQGVRQRHQE
jgi:ABC-type Mn2+/Zn2+ transport system ATPase subunit